MEERRYCEGETVPDSTDNAAWLGVGVPSEHYECACLVEWRGMIQPSERWKQHLGFALMRQPTLEYTQSSCSQVSFGV